MRWSIFKKTLGFGTVSQQSKVKPCNDIWSYRVSSLPDLYKILLILNGNLMLHSREEEFAKFVTIFNQKIKNKGYIVKAQKLNIQEIQLLLTDFWPTR